MAKKHCKLRLLVTKLLYAQPCGCSSCLSHTKLSSHYNPSAKTTTLFFPSSAAVHVLFPKFLPPTLRTKAFFPGRQAQRGRSARVLRNAFSRGRSFQRQPSPPTSTLEPYVAICCLSKHRHLLRHTPTETQLRLPTRLLHSASWQWPSSKRDHGPESCTCLSPSSSLPHLPKRPLATVFLSSRNVCR